MVLPDDGAVGEAAADGAKTPSASCVGPSAALGAKSRGANQSVTVPSPPEPSAEALAQCCQAGSLEAFEQLVRRFENPIFNFLRRFTRHQQDAEDLTQETFVKAYRSLHRYRPSLAFAPWLFIIARRTAASHFRSAVRFEELPADSEVAQGNPASAMEERDEQNSLWKLVRTLKPKQAEAIWLRYAEGFSVAETARIMSTNQVHVKVLLHRARSALSKMLARQETAPVRGVNDSGNAPPPTIFKPSKCLL